VGLSKKISAAVEHSKAVLDSRMRKVSEYVCPLLALF
jgi:hypothetical protein